jgi:hypothetical protein
MRFGETRWCDRCNRTTVQCRNAGDCHEPEPLPSSGVAGADRFFATESRGRYAATTRPDRFVPPAEPPLSNRTGTP